MSLDPEGDCPYVDDSLPIEIRSTLAARQESRAEWLEREILPHEQLVRRALRRRFPAVDIDEVIQAAYLRLMVTSQVDHVTNGKSYFFRTAASEIQNCERRNRLVHFESVDFDAVDWAADEPAMENIVDSKRALERFNDALNELPPRQRAVVELRRIMGLRARPAAERLAMSVSSIEKLQTNAMRRLAAAVGRP